MAGPIKGSQTASLRVMIADDDPVALQFAASFFQRRGCVVQTVSDGAEAIDLAGDGEWDLILLDMCMTTVDGPEAAERIRQLPHGRQALIVALTGNTEPEEHAACEQAGMDAVCHKPINREDVARLLARLAGS